MKRFHTLLFSLTCPLALFSQSVGNIVIHKTDNTTETYTLEDVGQMRYTSEAMQLFLSNDMKKPASTISIEDISSVSVEPNHDTATLQVVEPQSNSRWYDFQRLFIKQDVMAGNLYWDGPFNSLTVDGNNDDLMNGIGSLNGSVRNGFARPFCPPADSIIRRLDNLTDVSSEVLSAAKGEVMLWEALGMFFQVRLFGAVPLSNDPAGVVEDFEAVKYSRVAVSYLYEYIIKTLERAIELLPERNIGGIDQYSAKGLLAKVYLTRAGFDEELTSYDGCHLVCQAHERNEADLQKAAGIALDVIQNSGRHLMPVYSDIFLGKNNINEEALISWRWRVNKHWTFQNSLQSELGMFDFSNFYDCWGDRVGPSVDLQEAFGEDALSETRTSKDARRKATMMMMGDYYDYFYTDLDGFDYTKFLKGGYHPAHGSLRYQASVTKANVAKHLYGTTYDHKQAGLGSPSNMSSSLYTHVLRLADVYLIYCEAVMGNRQQTTDATALDCFYQVRHRGVADYERPAAISWEDVWKERRLELALEGDRWGDFVRLYYYDPQRAIDELSGQRRNGFQQGKYDTSVPAPVVTDRTFTLPYPANTGLSAAVSSPPRIVSIKGSELPGPKTTVKVNDVSPTPACFGKPLTILGNGLDKVEWVFVPNVGRLQNDGFTATPNSLTICALPTKAQSGAIELGTGGNEPVFVSLQVIDPVIESINPQPAEGGDTITVHGRNLLWVDALTFLTQRSQFFPNDYGTVPKDSFIEQTDEKIVFALPLTAASFEEIGNKEWRKPTCSVSYSNDITYYFEPKIRQTSREMVLSAPKTVERGHTYQIIGLNMDVQSMFIGMTKADCFVHEKDPTDIMIDIIEFSVPEDMEEGTFKYKFQLWSGTTVIGPEVTVTSSKSQND